MENLNALIKGGVVSPAHTLSQDDIDTINNLSEHEVQTLISLKQKLGDDFLKRNCGGGAGTSSGGLGATSGGQSPANCFI